MRVVGFDPGVTSGVFCWDGPERWGATELRGMTEREQVATVLRKFGFDGGVLACEDFLLRGVGSTGREGLAPVRLLARVEQRIEDARDVGLAIELRMYYPSQAKGLVTDARLKDWGYWTRGSDHARDATRVGLLALRELGLWSPRI